MNPLEINGPLPDFSRCGMAVKQLRKLEQRIVKLEQRNMSTEPSREQTAMEAEQEAHQEALESYQTERHGNMLHSLCGLPTDEGETGKDAQKKSQS